MDLHLHVTIILSYELKPSHTETHKYIDLHAKLLLFLAETVQQKKRMREMRDGLRRIYSWTEGKMDLGRKN